ncbi:MAG: hypothetical protein HY821_01450 [Acidobacteria bacterium]|nr:hypothetical protein [Acidobacteriota bacterium]
MNRRDFLAAPILTAAASQSAPIEPVTAEVREHLGKPALVIRGRPVYASFYALTDCPGGRWSFEEATKPSLARFVEAGFRLFQLDLFLEDCMPRPGEFSIEPARRQIRGILDLCPDAAVVLRWHVNAPRWWNDANPAELVAYANGPLEEQSRTLPVRYLMDDLRRLKRPSLASEKWFALAQGQTWNLLQDLARTPEGDALAGIQVACGVYGEWHYWGFIRNEPDTSAPMQQRFDSWRKARGRAAVPVPSLEQRRALDDGIFRHPAQRQDVIDYYRCQQELVAERITALCGIVKKSWPRPIVAGTFYGYFFSMFDRAATGGHLCLHRVLSSPNVDYLSAPQAYGDRYRGLGASGISRGLTESVRLNGKLFLDEMDQTPSWQWRNDVDTAFQLTDLDSDFAILRRNVLESYTRGAGLWYYDFGPANNSGWWLDRRLMDEIARIRQVLDRYHQRRYQPAGDVLFVFDTEVFYYTGSIQGSDPLTDAQAVNRTITSAWQSGVALETIHLQDLPKADLDRFKVVVFANTWLMTAEQRRFIRDRVMNSSRHVVFQGMPAYCDGASLNIGVSRELTGLDLRKQAAPLFTVGDAAPGLSQHGNTWYSSTPPSLPADWRRIFRAAGAHLYVETNDIIHAGGGVVLLHSKEGGPRRLALKGLAPIDLQLPPKSSWLFDSATGERLL